MKNSSALEKKVDVIIATMATKTDLKDLATKADLEDLAISVQNNFDLTEKRIDARFAEVGNRFDQMDDRFDRIENVSIGNHERRIENIEDDIRVIKTKVGLKKAP